MQSRIFALSMVLAVALVPAAHGAVRSSSAPETTVPDVFVTIHVTMTDSRISLDRHTASRGDEARFIIRNTGAKSHTFTLGTTTTRGGARQTGFSRTVRPKDEKIILIFLDYRGPLPYRSTTKIDLNKPGMKGIFKIL